MEKKEKRANLRREAMNFDPRPCVLRSQKKVDEHLEMCDIHPPSNFEVEWCPTKTDVTSLPPIGGVYFHSQILALGVKLPLIPLIQNILPRFKVPPSVNTRGLANFLRL